jgi:hypothetical protein
MLDIWNRFRQETLPMVEWLLKSITNYVKGCVNDRIRCAGKKSKVTYPHTMVAGPPPIKEVAIGAESPNAFLVPKL